MMMRALLATLAVLLFTPGLSAQPIVVKAHGTATIGADGTGSCPGSVVEDACRRATVTAVGTTAIPIDLKISTPASTSIGTVILLNGGGATAYVETAGATAVTLVETLSKTDNFTVIQVACGTPTGATTGGCNVNPSGGGLKTAAGRIPTLIDAIEADSTLHLAGTPICVAGQSGGGLLAGYAPTHYGSTNIDLLITSGGPAFTREDYHCEGRTNATWSAILDARQLSGTGGGATGIPDLTDNAFGFNGARGDCAFGSNRGVVPWRADSIISAGADYRLPHTKWIFAFGATDTTTIVVPMARLLQDEIAAYNGGATCASGDNSVCYEHTAAATPHQIYSTANGTALIRTDLLVDCVNR